MGISSCTFALSFSVSTFSACFLTFPTIKTTRSIIRTIAVTAAAIRISMILRLLLRRASRLCLCLLRRLALSSAVSCLSLGSFISLIFSTSIFPVTENGEKCLQLQSLLTDSKSYVPLSSLIIPAYPYEPDPEPVKHQTNHWFCFSLHAHHSTDDNHPDFFVPVSHSYSESEGNTEMNPHYRSN